MTLHVGSDNIVEIRKGISKIAKVYKGSTLVFGYPAGKVLFEKSTPSTYSLNIKYNCKIQVWIVGAGGGGSYGYTTNFGTARTGGSGAYIYGTINIKAGNYTIVVGGGGYGSGGVGAHTAGNGGSSSFNGNTAGGGGGAYVVSAVSYGDGYGGTASVVTSGLTGSNGTAGSTADRYSVYGGGGASGYLSFANAGHNGYVKIVAV